MISSYKIKYAFTMSIKCTSIRKWLIIMSVLLISNECKPQFKYGAETVGLITSDTSQLVSGFLGSGFVTIDSCTVITCYHVFSESLKKPGFFASQTGRMSEIILVDSFPDNDIAIYKCRKKLTYRPLPLGKMNNLKVGDSIIYMGYDYHEKASVASLAKILNIDSLIINHSVVKRFIFSGSAINGYSGGPIFNLHGEVVGLIVQMLVSKNTGKLVSNVGYSIFPLLQLVKNSH